jgi:hypothetical protein
MGWTTGIQFPAEAMMGFLVFTIATSRLALGTTQLPVEWVAVKL